MRQAVKIFSFACIFGLLFNCAPSRLVKPLDKKQRAVSGSFGGALIHFAGAIVPLPFTTLGYAYGVTNRTTCFANLHTTSLLFGNLQSDLGCTVGLFEKPGVFGISASPALQLAWSMKQQSGFRLWPSLDLNAYYHLNKKSDYFYAGGSAWFEPTLKRAHDEPRSRMMVPNLHLGYTISKIKNQHQFELKYLGLGIPNLPGVVGYTGLAGKGTFGLYYAYTRKF